MKRRTFLQTSGVMGAAAVLPLPGLRPLPTTRSPVAISEAGTVILFQGDSITDCGRDRKGTDANAAGALGSGYPLLIASQLLATRAEAGYRFFNRGVSGNSVPDCDARWQPDTLDLVPDVLSILIGVNDYWHTLNGSYKGTADDYEHQFTALLARPGPRPPEGAFRDFRALHTLRTRRDHGCVVSGLRRAAEDRPAGRGRRGATFLSTQDLFDRLSRQAPPAYWAADGAHPTAAGHGAIADLWMDAVGL